MDFIVDFYNGLETLDLIIFWGIIIVIILLLIFSLIMISKNYKLKKIVNKIKDKENYNDKYEELPIKKENKQNQLQKFKDQQNINIENENKEEIPIILPEIPQIQKNIDNSKENISETIQTEKKFIAEEHVMEYNKNLFSIPNIKKTNEQYEIIKEQSEKMTNDIKNTKPIEMPTGPYQRNVLREMSLSQTSPIGLTTPKKKEDKKYDIAKDLEDSLNIEQKELPENKNKLRMEDTISQISRIPEENQKYNNKLNNNQNIEISRNDTNEYNNLNKEVYYKEKNNKEFSTKEKEILKKELSSIDRISLRKTEIKNDESKYNTSIIERRADNYKQQEIRNHEIPKINRETKQESLLSHSTNINDYEIKTKSPEYHEKTEQLLRKEFTTTKKNISQPEIDPQVKELLNSVSTVERSETKNISSEKYLEEVSRKLAEADIQDEIERTDYELEQEENAIISYKELMEKKDSIQTIDEEEAVISIEELMNRNNKKQKESDNKLYNLTDDEENDDFIKELKQFRSDL